MSATYSFVSLWKRVFMTQSYSYRNDPQYYTDAVTAVHSFLWTLEEIMSCFLLLFFLQPKSGLCLLVKLHLCVLLFCHYQLAMGRVDVRRTEAKEFWEQNACTPHEVLFLPFLSHASCNFVRVGCCSYPTGRSAKVKEVQDEPGVPLFSVLFGFLLSLWGILAFLCHNFST